MLKLLHKYKALERWQHGQITLRCEKDFLQACTDATYWAKKVSLLPEVDEQLFLEQMHFYGYIPNSKFWAALVERYKNEDVGQWYTALDTIVGCGNLAALNALNKQFDAQTLFYCFHRQGDNFRPMHPASLRWFLKDQGLLLVLKDYASFPHTHWYTQVRWDAVNEKFGTKAIVSMAKQWCDLPPEYFPREHTLRVMFSWIGILQQISQEKQSNSNQLFDMTATDLEQAMSYVCEKNNFHEGLLRTLGGIMRQQDYSDPSLCAILLHQHERGLAKNNSFNARSIQVRNNASLAPHILAAMDLHCGNSELTLYYLLAPILQKQPVHCQSDMAHVLSQMEDLRL